jgi:hypothetical protein
MNKIILQLWEESNLNDINLSNGCSLHIDLNEKNKYIKSIYDNRDSNVPDKYDRIVGDSVSVLISDELYNNLIKNKNLKLSESSFQNLKKFSDIIYKNNDM